MRLKAGLALLAVLTLAPPVVFAKLNVGDAAPNFTLPDSASTMHSLSDFRGQVVALLGWANF
jgi:hypothetical protein